MMIEFRGVRTSEGPVIMYQIGGEGSNGKPTVLDLGPSLLLANHSPTGFEWGYLGSGCAQLSLAILLHATGDPFDALHYYQRFKRDFVSMWGERWSITEEEVKTWLATKRLEEEAGAIVQAQEA
ncbi:hypothetical protein LCGC14_1767730 [marine sediment metagenome]|uniref:Uncharacterized protein n=1 Tax=marine sediment metagenome TaxID=412755 RepID=A0A0F9GZ63_9ZZZZ